MEHTKEKLKEKQVSEYGRKTIKFYYKNPDLHMEQVLWYISYLHKKVWNHMKDICNGKFDHIDTLLEQVNIKGQEEIQKLKDSVEIITREDGSYHYTKSKPLSEFGMLYCLGPIRNNDPELLQLPLNDLQKPCSVLAKSYKSFYELNKKGDQQARPPGYQREDIFFTIRYEKPKIVSIEKKSFLKINHKIVGLGDILIPIPSYVCNLIENKVVRFVNIKRVHRELDRSSDFQIDFVYETELVEKKQITQQSAIAGVDLGARRVSVVVSSNLSRVKNYELRNHDNYFTKKRQEIEVKMKTKTKGSRAWRKLADTISKLSNKWHNCQKDQQRKLARKIVIDTNADVFCVGTKTIRVDQHDDKDALSQTKHGTKSQHRAVQNTGNIARMTTFLQEKAVEAGKTIIKVPDHKPSGKNKKETVKIVGAIRNMEYGIANHVKHITIK